jgi:hypothetical protein
MINKIYLEKKHNITFFSILHKHHHIVWIDAFFFLSLSSSVLSTYTFITCIYRSSPWPTIIDRHSPFRYMKMQKKYMLNTHRSCVYIPRRKKTIVVRHETTGMFISIRQRKKINSGLDYYQKKESIFYQRLNT